MAVKFHELANSTAAHNFGAIMQEVADDITSGPRVRPHEQVEPEKEE